MHHRRKAVIRGLAKIDMVVWMDRITRTQWLTGQLIGTVCQHFIGIHIRLCAAASLPYRQREMIVEKAVAQFVGSGENISAPFMVKHTQRHVSPGGGGLL